MIARSRGLAQLLVVVLAGACSLAAQSKSPQDLAAGKLLVAPRDSPDPVFGKSVILLVRYDKTGALGLMLNHETKLPISRALPKVKGATRDFNPVFLGGPVELGAVFALARAPAKPFGANHVAANIYFIATKTGLEKELSQAANPSELRIYLGYCGWAPHQLENEVLDGRWYIFGRSEALAFDPKPATLWPRLIRETEERFARLLPAPPVW